MNRIGYTWLVKTAQMGDAIVEYSEWSLNVTLCYMTHNGTEKVLGEGAFRVKGCVFVKNLSFFNT